MLGRRRRKNPDPRSDQTAGGDGAAPGWDAITAAAAAIHGDAEPVHRAPVPGPALGGGVQGISAYRAPDHWHLVTYGLSELYDKVGDDPSTSGWGYELTLRTPADGEPPPWAFDLLERVARETQVRGTVFAPGHRIDTGRSIDGGEPLLTALAFTPDPQLGSITTPNGRLTFLQLVLVSGEELAEMKATSTAAVLSRLALADPYLVRGGR